MSDVDPTPETPVTIGDRLGWWRGDIAARMVTLEQQVAALQGTPTGNLTNVRSDLLAVNTALENLRGDIEQLRGPQDRNLSQIYTTLYDGLFVQGDVTDYPAHIRLNLELKEISERLDHLQAGIGAQPYESLELASVRGLLNALLTNASAGTYGLAPITKDGDSFSAGDYYADGRLYAVFDESPGTGITLSESGISLTSDNWAGWSCYIQTADPSPLEGNDVAPANRWYNLSGSGAKNWSVQQKYTIRVVLRAPITGAFITLTSALRLRADAAGPYQRIDLTSATWLEPVAALPSSGTTRAWPVPIYAAPGKYVQIRWVSGPTVRVWRYAATGGASALGDLTNVTTAYYQVGHYITLQPASDSVNLATPFTVEIYPS